MLCLEGEGGGIFGGCKRGVINWNVSIIPKHRKKGGGGGERKKNTGGGMVKSKTILISKIKEVK